MSAGAATLSGQYYDGRQPVGAAVTLIFAGREAVLIGAQVSHRYATNQLRVSPRVGRADRFIAMPDGGQFQCADHPLLDRLPHEIRIEGLVAWLERHVTVAIASVAIIVSLMLSGYVYGLPAAAKYVAERVPIETEQALGRQALAWLDSNQWFRPTRLGQDMQDRIREGFAGLHRGLPMASHYRLEFRDSSFVGPNAFALPGGAIVITDSMIKAAQSPDEVLAVLAHEVGHVELRHSMRHVLQNSAAAVVTATVTSDAASLSIAVAGLPVVLTQARYSREFEAEADDFAFALLRQRGISPEAFATLMERLAKDREGTERAFAFLSTHPVTAERVKRARAAATR